jgi:hypothetical protein
MLKFETQALAAGDHLGGHRRSRGEIRKEEEHREAVVKVTQSIDESRVSISNDMVEGITWLSSFLRSGRIALEPARIADIATSKCFGDLLLESLLFSKLV